MNLSRRRILKLFGLAPVSLVISLPKPDGPMTKQVMQRNSRDGLVSWAETGFRKDRKIVMYDTDILYYDTSKNVWCKFP